MFILIIMFPLLSAIICGFFGNWIGYKGATIFSSTLIFTTFLFSACTFCRVGLRSNPKYIDLGSWIQSGNLHVD